VARSWFRQNGVFSSRPPAGNAHRWAANVQNSLSIMKKHNLSTRIKILCGLCFLLVSTISCQNNSNLNVPIGTPASIGDFPLKEYWHKDFDNEIKAMALGSGILVTGLTEQNSAVVQAFDITSGASLWKSNLQGSNNAGISIVIIEKLIYVIYSPSIFAIDLDTGKLVFRKYFDTSSIDEIKAFTEKHLFMVKIS
jgi:outer membrane protein assembly factor BamB